MLVRDVLRIGPVIPVIVIDDVRTAVPLARALLAGGVRVLEITLRTPAGLGAIEAIVSEVEGVIVGAGTLNRASDFARVAKAGAAFCVSPGLTPELIAGARDCALPLLPGVMTPTEVIVALTNGFADLKFFPAEAAGGVTMLKALAGPFPDVTFCPTGGITAASAAQYLSLANVVCVGGSWLTPADVIKAGDWQGITQLARQSALPFSPSDKS